MGNQQSDELPSLEIPRHHMFGGSSTLMYGTSHIKQLLLKDGRSTIELDTLVYDRVEFLISYWRKIELLEKEPNLDLSISRASR